MIGFLADDLSGTGGIQYASIDLLRMLHYVLKQDVVTVARGTSEIPGSVFLIKKKNTFLFAINAIKFFLSVNYESLIISDSVFTVVALVLKILKPHKSLILWEHLDYRNRSSQIRNISRLIAPMVFQHIVCITNEQLQYWKRAHCIKVATLHNVPNPIRLPQMKRALSKSETLHRRQKRILIIGNNGFVKGLDILTQAWVMSPRDSWSLCLCGFNHRDPSFDPLCLNNQQSKMELVTLSQDELRVMIEQSEFVINFSRTEVLPLTFWEAYLAGTTYISGFMYTPSLAHQVLSRRAGMVLTHYSPNNLDMLFSDIITLRVAPSSSASRDLHLERLGEAIQNNDFVASQWMNILT